MKTLHLLVKKNIKLLFRAKSSSLIVFFAPLLLIIVIALSYGSSSEVSLKVGIHAAAVTPEVSAFVDSLEQQQLTVVTYDGAIEDCIEDIKYGFVHTCVELPQSFEVTDAQKEVRFFIDPSNTHLVGTVQQTVEEKFNQKSTEISQGLSSSVLGSVSASQNDISLQKQSIARLRETTASISGTAQATQEQLEGVTTVVTTSAVDTSVAEALKSDLTQAKTNLEAATTQVNSINMTTSEKSAINSKISSGSTNIDAALLALEGENGLKKIIEVLQGDVTATQNALTAAATSISAGANQVGVLKGQVDARLQDIGAIESSLGNIEINLKKTAGQDVATLSSPLTTKVEMVAEATSFLHYLFPALLVLVIMFSSLLLSSTFVQMDKHSPARLRNFFLPLKRTTFLFGTYVTNMLLLGMQVSIILFIALFFVDDLLAALPGVALAAFLSLTTFTFLGMSIGYLFRSEETSMVAAISTGSLLLFVSGVVLPLESVSPTLREVMTYNPFVIAERVIREILIFGAPLGTLLVDFGLLFGYAALFFVVVLLAETLIRHDT